MIDGKRARQLNRKYFVLFVHFCGLISSLPHALSRLQKHPSLAKPRQRNALGKGEVS